jgi:zinc D-Ala-D-Ala carboxypeptidase
MSARRSAPPASRRGRRLLVVLAVLLGVLGAAAAALGEGSPTAGSALDVLHRADRSAVGAADGVLPAGTTVSDDLPGVAGLDPALLAALRRAAADAADAGIALQVTSGWRSAAYQEQLLREAVARYGSAEEAARWVAGPGTSAHVSGNAVDVGPAAAWTWLAGHGAGYSLCPVYANEPWHWELRAGADVDGCPPTYRDPTEDPRTHR